MSSESTVLKDDNEINDQKSVISVSKRFKPQFYMNDNILNSALYSYEQMQIIYNGIAQNIYRMMDSKGMTLGCLASISGVTASSLSKILNYHSPIGLKSLLRISFAFECSPVELFPDDLNKRKTNGDRFEELTRDMDVATVNFLLEQAAGLSKLRKIKKF